MIEPTGLELRAHVAERRKRSYELHLRGVDHGTIAEQLGSPGGPAGVAEDIRAVLRESIRRAGEDVDVARATEIGRLDLLLQRSLEILDDRHPVLYQGAIVHGVEDAGPRLAAIDRVLRIGESRRKLLGLDAPTRVGVSGVVRYELAGVDVEQLT